MSDVPEVLPTPRFAWIYLESITVQGQKRPSSDVPAAQQLTHKTQLRTRGPCPSPSHWRSLPRGPPQHTRPAQRCAALAHPPESTAHHRTITFTASAAKKTQTTRPCWRTSLTLLSFRPPLDKNHLWFSQTWRRSYGWRFWVSPGGQAPPEARCLPQSPSLSRLLPAAGLWARPPATLQEGKVCRVIFSQQVNAPG